jgi:hypothetical protein
MTRRGWWIVSWRSLQPDGTVLEDAELPYRWHNVRSLARLVAQLLDDEHAGTVAKRSTRIRFAWRLPADLWAQPIRAWDR